MLKELAYRDGLLIALGGRDERTLEPLLQFLFKYIGHPTYTKTLIEISHLVLDLYASVAGKSLMLSELLHKLQERVKEEIRIQKSMTRVLGLLDSFVAMQ